MPWESQGVGGQFTASVETTGERDISFPSLSTAATWK
jgi:hypothetical protein